MESFQYFPSLRFSEYCQKLDSIKKTGTLENIDSLLLTESKESFFVFKDGVFCPELSNLQGLGKKVVVLTLEEALKGSYASFLRHRWQTLLQQETDPFALLNGALCEGGLFLYIPPKVKLQTPLQFIFVQTKESLLHVAPRVHIFAGADSEVHFVTSTEGGALCNGFIDVAVEERSFVFHTSYTGHKNESFGFTSFRGTLKKESFLRSLICSLDVNCRREDYKVSLLGERAEVDLMGLSGVSDNSQSHINIQVDHIAPSCRSKQLFKQVLLGQSRASFTGKIHVTRLAQKTEAYQLSRSLLLSDLAIAYAKPNLEIFADDVKASHGATICQIDEEQKFYLQSRGV
ncbi:MAG: SufD family Fe-S cluster assembly protein, partial [Verrucomicrobia bacterium]|nr:SufD family Fe-S cluster assembly protein [Verrucomicrobiota bacterium]